MAKPVSPLSLVSLAVKEATNADNKTLAVKGHSVRYACHIVTLCAMDIPTVEREDALKQLGEALDKLPTVGKGYHANAKRIAAAGRDAAEKLLKHCSDPANGWKSLSTVFSSKQWGETFPAIIATGRRASTNNKAQAPADIRVDTRDGAILALQSMMAAKTKLGIQTGKPLDTLENALTEALSILRAAKPAEPPAK